MKFSRVDDYDYLPLELKISDMTTNLDVKTFEKKILQIPFLQQIRLCNCFDHHCFSWKLGICLSQSLHEAFGPLNVWAWRNHYSSYLSQWRVTWFTCKTTFHFPVCWDYNWFTSVSVTHMQPLFSHGKIKKTEHRLFFATWLIVIVAFDCVTFTIHGHASSLMLIMRVLLHLLSNQSNTRYQMQKL